MAKVKEPSKAPSKDPTIKSLSLVRTQDGLYQVLEILTKGKEVIQVNPLEAPNAKAIANETLKIAIVRSFFGDLTNA